MHPLLAKGRNVLYLLVWAAMGGLLGYMLTITGRLAWQEAALLALPLALFYAFVCLAPWYMCRVLPLGEGQLPKLVGNHLAAAIAAALFWIVVAKVLGLALTRYYPTAQRAVQSPASAAIRNRRAALHAFCGAALRAAVARIFQGIRNA